MKHSKNSSGLSTIHYMLVSSSLTLSVIAIVFCGFTYIQMNKTASHLNSNDLFTAEISLTIIAGVLAGFSFLSIFSVFNANVDHYQNRIDKLMYDVNDNSSQVQELIKEDRNLHDKTNELAKENKVDRGTSVLVTDFFQMDILLSNYTDDFQKTQAIVYFNERDRQKVEDRDDRPVVPKDVVKILSTYFRSLKKNRHSNLFYEEFENLVEKWRQDANYC